MMKTLPRRASLGVLVVLCGLAPLPSWGQPFEPVELAPTVLITSSRGALQNIDPLVDPDPLFLFASQTTAATLTLQSFRFSGPVDLTAACCWNARSGQAVAGSGISVAVNPSQVTLPFGESATSTLTVTTSGAPTTGSFLLRVMAQNQAGIEGRAFLLLSVLPSVPADGPRSACPRLNPAGSPPPPGPEVLPLASVTRGLFATKSGSLRRTSFFLAVAAAAGNNGWDVTIDKAPPLSPPLAPNEALVVLDNPKTWDKSLVTINSSDCNAGRTLTVLPGQSASIRISSSDTTTLLLNRRVCRFWLFWCWDDGGSEDVAVFTEPPFWTLFGGRRVTISWTHSFQVRGIIER